MNTYNGNAMRQRLPYDFTEFIPAPQPCSCGGSPAFAFLGCGEDVNRRARAASEQVMEHARMKQRSPRVVYCFEKWRGRRISGARMG
jgi:hypothetical protein